MKHFIFFVSVAIAIANNPAQADILSDWNNNTIQAIRTDGMMASPLHPGPTEGARVFAMVEVAVFDAVNSIDRNYAPYHFQMVAPAGTSREAAVASAAYTVLANLYPNQITALNTQLNNSLSIIPNGPGKTAGISLGNQMGADMVSLRTNDGSGPGLPYTPGTGPGDWRPDPLHPTQKAYRPQWGEVTPFALQNGSQFRPPPPPDLTSAQYTAAFNQVKAIGGDGIHTPTIRTADQTAAGMFWAYDTGGLGPPPILYNQIAQTIIGQHGGTMDQNARLYALINMAMMDAGIAAWDSKFAHTNDPQSGYAHDFWRPIAAIREAGTDGNPNTVPDPTWTPLGAPNPFTGDSFTPPFPAYVSGHATFGAALFQTLTDFYGTDNIPFTFTSDEPGGGTRSFSTLSQAKYENAESRIWLGIHWQFDADYGILTGDSVGNWVFTSQLQPVPEPATLTLLAMAGIVLGVYQVGRRRRKKGNDHLASPHPIAY